MVLAASPGILIVNVYAGVCIITEEMHHMCPQESRDTRQLRQREPATQRAVATRRQSSEQSFMSGDYQYAARSGLFLGASGAAPLSLAVCDVHGRGGRRDEMRHFWPDMQFTKAVGELVGAFVQLGVGQVCVAGGAPRQPYSLSTLRAVNHSLFIEVMSLIGKSRFRIIAPIFARAIY